MKLVKINEAFEIGGNNRFTLIAGPCAIESEEMCLEVAETLKQICEELRLNFVFKSSFDKANRSSIFSPRGVGLSEGLRILEKVRSIYDVPVVTDVHESWQCNEVGAVVDMIQIPAFLARQTDLLVAAAKTGRAVNVKKGQFMAPWDMKQVIQKCCEAGNDQILLCERGSSFGYNNLIVDMTGLIEMRSYGYPVVFDATHSVQKPGGNGSTTGGNRDYVPYLLNAALAVGVVAIFVEVQTKPERAFSVAATQVRLSETRPIPGHAITIDIIPKGVKHE